MTGSKNKKPWIILLAVLAVLSVYCLVAYNRLVSKEEKLTNNWNNLQAQYQRRFDMIPRLAEVVKASSDFEKNTLVKLTEIRSQKGGKMITGDPNAGLFNGLESEQNELATTFNQLMAVVERYPDIKSQQNYVRLQDQIKGTESRIKWARRDFNEAIQDYNTYVRSFPSNLAAKLFGYKHKDGFSSDPGADKAVEIKFGE